MESYQAISFCFPIRSCNIDLTFPQKYNNKKATYNNDKIDSK